MIAIIDYDAGNIKSVEKALLSLGQEVTVTAKQDEILGAHSPHHTIYSAEPSAFSPFK